MYGHAVHVCDLARADAGGNGAVPISWKRRKISVHDVGARARALRNRQTAKPQSRGRGQESAPREVVIRLDACLFGHGTLRQLKMRHDNHQDREPCQGWSTLRTLMDSAQTAPLPHLKAACALHFAWYNFCRIHSSLRETPAMAAGLTDHVWAF